jgi:hypothetical protein
MLVPSNTIKDLGTVDRAAELIVGTNYHPHDSNPETRTRDIQLMQQAGSVSYGLDTLLGTATNQKIASSISVGLIRSWINCRRLGSK